MINHFHPKTRINMSINKIPRVNSDFLRWATRDVPDAGLLPGDRMIRHWEACLLASEDLDTMSWTEKRDLVATGWFSDETLNKSTVQLHKPELNASRAPRGAVWEAIVYDCVIHFKHRVLSVYAYASGKHRPSKKGEFDLSVRGSSGREALIPVKTSMRERGPSQFDYAFVVFERDQTRSVINSTSLVAITLCEHHPKDTADVATRHTRAATDVLYSLNGRIISAYDSEWMNEFFHNDLAGCSCPDAATCLLSPSMQVQPTSGPAGTTGP